jgi:hypothetical protein
MTTTHCDYCHHHVDSRLVKQVNPPDWEDGGMACAGCRGRLDEIDTLHDQDRVDAARWRALRPLLRLEGRVGETRIVSKRFPIYLDTVEQCVDKMIEQGHL